MVSFLILNVPLPFFESSFASTEFANDGSFEASTISIDRFGDVKNEDGDVKNAAVFIVEVAAGRLGTQNARQAGFLPGFQQGDLAGRLARLQPALRLGIGSARKRRRGPRDPALTRLPEVTMPRAIWSGSISFGLVNVPVKLYSAVRQKDLQFHQFDKQGNRIHYKRVSEKSGREVPYEDIVKGYELSKGQHVLIEPEELEAYRPETTRTIGRVSWLKESTR